LNIPVHKFSGVMSFKTDCNGMTLSVMIAGDSEYTSASINLIIPGCLIVFIRFLNYLYNNFFIKVNYLINIT